MHIVVLNEEVAVQVVLVFAKVKVSHLKGNEFSTAKTGSESRQEQRIVLGTNLAGRVEEGLHLFRCQRHALFLCALCSAGEPP